MRILVADDDADILRSYQTIFGAAGAGPRGDADLDAVGDALFGALEETASREADRTEGLTCEVDYVSQGEDAAASVAKAVEQGRPYSVVFLDMRMPPGIDGKETARRVRALDPDVNIVMVTGFSDHTPQSVAKAAPPTDKLFYLVKPFEPAEILQLADSLHARWSKDVELEAARAELARQFKALESANLELAASEARAVKIASRDALTGVANRIAFITALKQRLSDPTAEAGVLFIDLDRFKSVNDTIGHLAADELVRDLSRALEAALPPGGLLARMGGDEFAALIPSSSQEILVAVAERMVGLCAQPYTFLGHTVKPSASIGVAWRTGPECFAADLLRSADLALYAAKREGRARWRLYDEKLNETSKMRGLIEQGLQHALENDELSLVYQPIVDQSSGTIAGFEALIRWRRPDGEMISPATFIPIAEQSNLIHQVGDWVVRRAMTDCARWSGPYISINLSPRQFRKFNLVEHLLSEARRAGIDPSRVQLEITETALFDNMAAAATVLQRLRNFGFRIALDDFGTGYASLVYLRNFEIDCIKIDGSFVADLGRGVQSPAIVQSIANLARTLGMTVVAEGVEDDFQQQALRMTGCGYLQGYHLGRPMTLEAVQSALAEAGPAADAPACAGAQVLRMPALKAS